MRSRKAAPALAVVAVGGALILGGCGSGDDSTSSKPAKATTPASQVSDGAMKHGDAMKGDDDAMKQHGDAMKHDSDAMHGDAMKGDSKEP